MVILKVKAFCFVTPCLQVKIYRRFVSRVAQSVQRLATGSTVRDRIPVGARFSAPVQNDPGAHPASCTMGTGSFPEVKSGRGMTLTLHLLLVPWSRKSRVIPILPLWAVRPVQSLSACTGVHFIFTFYRSFGGTTVLHNAGRYIPFDKA